MDKDMLKASSKTHLPKKGWSITQLKQKPATNNDAAVNRMLSLQRISV
jgi:hypothetical protein